MILNFSDDLKRNIILCLPAHDILKLLSTCTDLHRIGCENSTLWDILLQRDDPERLESFHIKEMYEYQQEQLLQLKSKNDDDIMIHDRFEEVRCYKKSRRRRRKKAGISCETSQRSYIQSSHVTALSQVRWKTLMPDPSTPDRREGHLMTNLNGRIVLTGGYCSDEDIYILDVPVSGNKNNSSGSGGWKAVKPLQNDCSPSYVYGATLTNINDNCAVRFGGFQAGGCTLECSSLYLLMHSKNEKNKIDQFQWIDLNKRVCGPKPEPRAYHSATLVGNRYLVIIGGMKTGCSIMSEAILDVKTWTWLPQAVCRRSNNNSKGGKDWPSRRYGHSVVLHEKKDRLVLFGGGFGHDLLSTERDSSEVWEMSIGKNWKEDLPNSLPWKWKLLHSDAGLCGVRDERVHMTSSLTTKSAILASSTNKCLARCHVATRVSGDTVIFFSGGVYPSTNEIFAYDLSQDSWKNPIVQGYTPLPRFTAAASTVDDW
eukprot:CAMPEP_0194403434 /NCGR_PEP_ID=MMETSP0176-20130528/2035_1 /TAXON_ID=216777 /ORGANISM="Proboscia alata, Strain PI-D3" /LENGTH=483 /DNA_ID=CAMNT_0039201231 /DNA_START=42 /DNA_END=1490 /DNA_ORIENTATION=-